MSDLLPTGVFGSWTVTSFRDSFITHLREDRGATSLRLFFYAATLSGWNEVERHLARWQRKRNGRFVTIYVGTDHGITDPDALDAMREAGVKVRLMTSYSGVYHPKVVWLSGRRAHVIWIASNNLTRDGLINNVEFAALVRAATVPAALRDWARQVDAGSTPIDDDLLRSYRRERSRFEQSRAAAKAMTFTWSRRVEAAQRRLAVPRKGDLIVEIMPEETRGGNQIQLPKEAVRPFFGLQYPGDKLPIQLKQKGSGPFRNLLVSVFENNTVRLSINELEYRDRPCVVVLRKLSAEKVEFEIVSESVFPTRYRRTLDACTSQTRVGSRRWVIVEGA